METHWSSEPEGNLTITLEPVLSSVSFRGRNLMMVGVSVETERCILIRCQYLQITLMESSSSPFTAACSASPIFASGPLLKFQVFT